jgi:tetratricopeptide (TPR) repeat protein
VADSRIDELRRRLERDPGSRLFAQLAEEYRKVGNHADAIRVARTGLALHPAYPSARLTLGRALLDSGDPEGARVELETVLRDAPDNILASRFLGQALEALGELRPALVQLQRTLRMAPGDRQLEGQIVSLQTRLRAPQPAGAAPLPESSGADLPPTLRIVPSGDRGVGGRKAPGPPPLPATAAPPAVAPAAVPPPPPVLEQTTPLRALRPPLPSPAAAVVARPSAPSPIEDSDLAPTLPSRRPAEFGPVDETTLPTLPPRSVAAEETVFEAEAPSPAGQGAVEARAPQEVTSPTGTPFSSSTLAELYLRQGLVERAVEVYRRVVAEEPGNARARSRLAELEGAPPPTGGRAARRAALERTIARLEALLAAVRRR